MDWLKHPRYNDHRKVAVKQLSSVFSNPTTIRRIERQLYNITTKESEISSWSNAEYVETYFKVLNRFINKVTKDKINESEFDGKVLHEHDITDVLGYENYRYIMSEILDDNIAFYRKNIIFNIYEKLTNNEKFNILDNKEKIFLAIDIEKSCYDNLKKIIAEKCYDEFHHKEEIRFSYDYITCRTLTLIDNESENCSSYVIENIINPEVYTKLGFMSSEDLFKDKFQAIKDEIEFRQNITITEKISTEYTCKVCKVACTRDCITLTILNDYE